MITVAVVVLSDKGARGERADESGRVLQEMIQSLGTVVEYLVLPDDQDKIVATLEDLSERGVQLVLTSGGTGVAPRDVTPEATLQVCERLVPGLAEAMRATSLSKTPHAMLSRGVAGIRKNTLIINLPGSPKAVRENLEVVLPAIPHAVAKICGDPSDCATA